MPPLREANFLFSAGFGALSSQKQDQLCTTTESEEVGLLDV